MEWLDANGNKVAINRNTTTNNPMSNKLVYIWDMHVDPEDSGVWCSAEEYKGEYQGFVYESEFEAIKYGRMHLSELEEKGELRGDADDYSIEAIAIPMSKVSKDTLRLSGIN